MMSYASTSELFMYLRIEHNLAFVWSTVLAATRARQKPALIANLTACSRSDDLINGKMPQDAQSGLV
jgi:hypothetical protein